ncbi:hypothetical protein [Bacillus solimangrovi]|nr:hypothetical protein [Bacillus solimangrovi]
MPNRRLNHSNTPRRKNTTNTRTSAGTRKKGCGCGGKAKKR